jgi:hypothetical protein
MMEGVVSVEATTYRVKGTNSSKQERRVLSASKLAVDATQKELDTEERSMQNPIVVYWKISCFLPLKLIERAVDNREQTQ